MWLTGKILKNRNYFTSRALTGPAGDSPLVEKIPDIEIPLIQAQGITHENHCFLMGLGRANMVSLWQF